MEHRYSVRRPVEFQLILYKQGLPVQRGVGRNLGLGGVFVDGGETKWRRNERLEVEFVDFSGKPLLRIAAVVVHYEAKGVGLMFDAVNNQQWQDLRTLLSGRSTDPDTDRGKEAGGRYAAA